jgi:hypothetical protein
VRFKKQGSLTCFRRLDDAQRRPSCRWGAQSPNSHRGQPAFRFRTCCITRCFQLGKLPRYPAILELKTPAGEPGAALVRVLSKFESVLVGVTYTAQQDGGGNAKVGPEAGRAVACRCLLVGINVSTSADGCRNALHVASRSSESNGSPSASPNQRGVCLQHRIPDAVHCLDRRTYRAQHGALRDGACQTMASNAANATIKAIEASTVSDMASDTQTEAEFLTRR